MPQNRDETGQFQRGQSGNPGGRPKGLGQTTRDLVGKDGQTIAEFWVAVMCDETAKMSDRLEASRLLADRGWGKSPAHVTLDDERPHTDDARLEEAVLRFNAEVLRLAPVS